MKILLVDDEELQLIRLKNAARKALPRDCEFLCYTNPVKAFEENAENKIDIAFLDIETPVINGIQLAKKLKDVNPQINIIFVTAYDAYALDAYNLHASGYITKPVNESKIKEELDGLRFPVEEKHEQNHPNDYRINAIAANIKNHRNRLGLSVSELAKKMDVSYQTVYRWESGERIPDITMLIELANIFGVSIEDIMAN
jgi:two-component SAPR family response regulator